MGLLYKRESSTYQDATLNKYYASSGTTDKPVIVRNIDSLPVDVSKMREFSESFSGNINNGATQDITMTVSGNNTIRYFQAEVYQGAGNRIGPIELYLDGNLIETSPQYNPDQTIYYFSVPQNKTERDGQIYTIRFLNNTGNAWVYTLYVRRIVEII